MSSKLIQFLLKFKSTLQNINKNQHINLSEKISNILKYLDGSQYLHFLESHLSDNLLNEVNFLIENNERIKDSLSFLKFDNINFLKLEEFELINFFKDTFKYNSNFKIALLNHYKITQNHTEIKKFIVLEISNIHKEPEFSVDIDGSIHLSNEKKGKEVISNDLFDWNTERQDIDKSYRIKANELKGIIPSDIIDGEGNDVYHINPYNFIVNHEEKKINLNKIFDSSNGQKYIMNLDNCIIKWLNENHETLLQILKDAIKDIDDNADFLYLLLNLNGLKISNPVYEIANKNLDNFITFIKQILVENDVEDILLFDLLNASNNNRKKVVDLILENNKEFFVNLLDFFTKKPQNQNDLLNNPQLDNEIEKYFIANYTVDLMRILINSNDGSNNKFIYSLEKVYPEKYTKIYITFLSRLVISKNKELINMYVKNAGFAGIKALNDVLSKGFDNILVLFDSLFENLDSENSFNILSKLEEPVQDKIINEIKNKISILDQTVGQKYMFYLIDNEFDKYISLIETSLLDVKNNSKFLQALLNIKNEGGERALFYIYSSYYDTYIKLVKLGINTLKDKQDILMLLIDVRHSDGRSSLKDISMKDKELYASLLQSYGSTKERIYQFIQPSSSSSYSIPYWLALNNCSLFINQINTALYIKDEELLISLLSAEGSKNNNHTRTSLDLVGEKIGIAEKVSIFKDALSLIKDKNKVTEFFRKINHSNIYNELKLYAPQYLTVLANTINNPDINSKNLIPFIMIACLGFKTFEENKSLPEEDFNSDLKQPGKILI